MEADLESTQLKAIEWKAKNEILDKLLDQAELQWQELEQGFEAEVKKFSAEQESFVLKIWNKGSRPDVEYQYRLLEALYEQGVSVSKPIGWGIHAGSDQALLTTYDGGPVQKLNKDKIKQMAQVLSGIHQVGIQNFAAVQLPAYDFIGYFFPGIREYAALEQALSDLVRQFPIKQACLIHGDYHPRNLVEEGKRLTVIDWTNAQLGDARYDLAWALVLLKLYVSDRHADSLRTFYLQDNPLTEEKLEAFEAMAIIRWILLAKSGGAPTAPVFLQRIAAFIKGNAHLNESAISDFV